MGRLDGWQTSTSKDAQYHLSLEKCRNHSEVPPPLRMTTNKQMKLTIPSAGGVVEQLELSNTPPGGDIKCYNRFGKTAWPFLIKLHTRLPYVPTIPRLTGIKIYSHKAT